MKYVCVLLIVSAMIQTSLSFFPNYHRKITQKEIVGDPGDPLFLTPLLEQNKIEEAQAAAQVILEEVSLVKSYSGFFTVNKDFDSNLFFWFFPSKTDYENAPVVLWLQGGPGSTSLFGLFTENGPFVPISETEMKYRNVTWTEHQSVLYIDNPVGTGFSFTNNGYAQNQTKVGEDLYNALQQFFTLFPHLQKNEFYISGESYAGKYIPAISYAILKKNPNAELKINLKGLAIGDGLSDPEHQFVKYGDYLYYIGLIDKNTRDEYQKYEQEGLQYIQNKEFDKAAEIFESVLMGSLFTESTGFENVYNYLYDVDRSREEYFMNEYVQSTKVRAAIHVGNVTFNSGETVDENLQNDIMQSVAPWVSELLSNYRVILYSGQMDIIVAYPLTLNYLDNLKFSGDDEYKMAKRQRWYVGEDLAGYVKVAGNLTEVLVRNAGHMVPTDQPEWAYNMIYNFVRNEALITHA